MNEKEDKNEPVNKSEPVKIQIQLSAQNSELWDSMVQRTGLNSKRELLESSLSLVSSLLDRMDRGANFLIEYPEKDRMQELIIPMLENARRKQGA